MWRTDSTIGADPLALGVRPTMPYSFETIVKSAGDVFSRSGRLVWTMLVESDDGYGTTHCLGFLLFFCLSFFQNRTDRNEGDKEREGAKREGKDEKKSNASLVVRPAP